MKVLVIDNSRWWGGAEKNLTTLIYGKNSAIKFVVLSDYSMSHNTAFQDFCETRYRFKNTSLIKYFDGKYKSRTARALRLIYKSLYLIPVLLREQPDIVHFYLYRTSDALEIIISKLFRKRVVLHIHSLASQIKISPWSIKFADAVICVSESVKQGFSFIGNKFHVLYNGIDEKDCYPIHQNNARAKLKLNPKSFIVGSIGNIESRKGHDVAVRALKKIIDNGNAEASLIIVGKDPTEDKSETKRIETLCRNLGVQDAVKVFSASSEDMGCVYSACDIVLSVSVDGEAFGMIPLEAALYNCPVIATNIGAYRETIIDKKTGLLCEPNSPDMLAQAIETLAYDKDYCNKIAENAKKNILEEFSVHVYRKTLYGIYQTVFSKE
jgi:glycosyltransferase involved in cell wall biosynthesis